MRNNKGMSCLIDSDIVIDFLRDRPYAVSLLEHWAGEGLLAISVLTHLEAYCGMKAGEEKATSTFLDGLISIPLDVTIAQRAGKMLADLRPQGITVGIAYAVIAATALELNVTLLTNNVEHYPFPDLKVVRGMEK